MSIALLVLDKSGEITEKKVKGVERLYSVCNYRNEEGFEELHSWTTSTITYSLYGKRKGKNNYENHCTLPQPIHQELYYGNLCLVKRVGGEPQSMTLEEWKQFIEGTKEESKSDLKELKKEDYEPEPIRNP